MAMDDFYGDGDTDESRATKEPQDRDDATSETSLLPKSLFPGKDCKPGDVLKVKVVAVHEDELEVRGAGYDKKKSDEESDETEDSESSEDDESMFG